MAATKELIKRIRLTSSAASISFYNIPQDFDDLEIVVSARSTYDNVGYESEPFKLSINGSTANFTSRELKAESGATSAARTDNRFGYVNDSGSTASTFTSFAFYLPNYTSNAYKSISMDATPEGNFTGDSYITISAGLWSQTAAITSLSINANTGNLAQYTSAALYGYKGGSDGTTTVS